MGTIIIFIAFALIQLFDNASAQVRCTNPLRIGELRVHQSKECVDITGKDGSGSLKTHKCDGYSDQQIVLCGDGTIRNEARNFCFTPKGKGNTGVESSPCQHYPAIPSSQKWRLGKKISFNDAGGILQE